MCLRTASTIRTGDAKLCPGDELSSGNVCRPGTDECDLAEICDGASIDCPADTGGACELCGMKFYDASADGEHDASESGVEGWVIIVTAEDGTTTTIATGADGGYDIGGLASGTYTVCEAEALEDNWMQTAPADFCYTVDLP